MFGVGFLEIILIAIVALVVVGPKRLPEVMRQAGRLFVHVRRTANDVRSTFDQVIKQAEDELRLEEADAIRKALKPVQDAHKDVKALLSGTLADHAPIGARALGLGDHPLQSLAADILQPAPAPQGTPEPALGAVASAPMAQAAVAAPGAAPAPTPSTGDQDGPKSPV